eukprot:TRINITY_DN12424_c0_g1_i1.p1 TRINITY_DN12424_c0_g1~~TRINITY_DN12424_c0_g1_i1.p1  ORF type:complete len:350 (+),score=32.23 TRINITY_DN12424_c0_g1_i1:50-1099(+)
MVTIWVRRRQDPEHAEIKVTVGRDGHVSDVLEKASGLLVFEGGQQRVAGGLCAVVDGRVLSNKEPAAAWDGRSMVVQERGTAGGYTGTVVPHISEQQHHVIPHTGISGVAQQHTCAKCHMPILGLKVVLTLPGRSSAVDLHPDCELEYERQNALSCNYCGDLILDRLTTLTGDFGTINLHPQCVDPYKKAPNDFPLRGSYVPSAPNPASFQPLQGYSMGGGAGGFTCSYCKNVIEGTKVSLKLPGFQHKADLHPQCEYQYSVNHALKCDYCHQPMLDGITVLTGDFDSRSVQLHPACVPTFKQSHTGHAPWTAPNAAQQAQYAPSAVQWRPVEGSAPMHGSVRWATSSG